MDNAFWIVSGRTNFLQLFSACRQQKKDIVDGTKGGHSDKNSEQDRMGFHETVKAE